MTIAPIVSAEAPPLRYRITLDVAEDTVTRLVWQRGFSAAMPTLAAAEAYCAGLSIDGGGFRLPRVNELITLIDPSVDLAPASAAGPPPLGWIDLSIFPDTPREDFWTSTPVAGRVGNWRVSFLDGPIFYEESEKSARVRCVR